MKILIKNQKRIKFRPMNKAWKRPVLIRKHRGFKDLWTGKQNPRTRRFIDYGIIALLILSPLPAASTPDWAVPVIQIMVFVLFAAFVLLKKKPGISPELEKALYWPKRMFLGFFVYLGVQILPLPVFIVKILSPNAVRFREQFSAQISEMKLMSISLSPYQTFREGMEILAYVLLGYLVISTVTTRPQIRKIFYVLIGMGIFESLYGMFELYRNNPRILFYKKDINLYALTGTFVSQNHLTGYLEMILPLAVALMIVRLDLLTPIKLNMKDRLLRLTEKGPLSGIFLSGSMFVIAAGIILSRSRSGAFLLIFTFFLFFQVGVLLFRGQGYTSVRVKRVIQISFLLVTVFALYAGIGSTLERFSLERLSQEQRPQYWTNVTKISGDYVLFGTGLGTFATVYPAYETIGLYGVLRHAHNDHLEYFSELGLFGSFFLLGGILLILINAVRVWLKRKNPEMTGLASGGLIAILIIGLHSITDFNLHIPANMLLFAVILSLTLAVAFFGRHPEKENKRIQEDVQNQALRGME